MEKRQEGVPGLGSRLFFLFFDTGMLIGIGAYFFAWEVDSDRFPAKLLMFLTVLGLSIGAAIGVVRRFKINMELSRQQLTDKEVVQHESSNEG